MGSFGNNFFIVSTLYTEHLAYFEHLLYFKYGCVSFNELYCKTKTKEINVERLKTKKDEVKR